MQECNCVELKSPYSSVISKRVNEEKMSQLTSPPSLFQQSKTLIYSERKKSMEMSRADDENLRPFETFIDHVKR